MRMTSISQMVDAKPQLDEVRKRMAREKYFPVTRNTLLALGQKFVEVEIEKFYLLGSGSIPNPKTGTTEVMVAGPIRLDPNPEIHDTEEVVAIRTIGSNKDCFIEVEVLTRNYYIGGDDHFVKNERRYFVKKS